MQVMLALLCSVFMPFENLEGHASGSFHAFGACGATAHELAHLADFVDTLHAAEAMSRAAIVLFTRWYEGGGSAVATSFAERPATMLAARAPLPSCSHCFSVRWQLRDNMRTA